MARGASVALVTWAPFVFMFIAAPAIRLALAIPIELRANWIFRMTEDRRTRADAIGAGVVTILLLGIVAPLGLLLPLQWSTLGPIAATITGVNLLVAGCTSRSSCRTGG